MPPIVFGTRFGTPKVIEIGPKCSQNGPNGTPRESLKIFIFFNGSERGKRAEKEPKRSQKEHGIYGFFRVRVPGRFRTSFWEAFGRLLGRLREAQGDLSTRGGTLCNGPLKQGRSGGDGGIIGLRPPDSGGSVFSLFYIFF